MKEEQVKVCQRERCMASLYEFLWAQFSHDNPNRQRKRSTTKENKLINLYVSFLIVDFWKGSFPTSRVVNLHTISWS
jgi:hypothetical protein